MKTDLFRIFGWVVPGICLASSAGVLYNRYTSLAAAQLALENANQAVRLATEEKSAVELQPAAQRFAAADESKMEETSFLTDIRQRAKACGVNIVSWSSQASPASPARAAITSTSKGAEVAKPVASIAGDPLADITKVVSNLSLAGPYRSLRAFVGGLASSDRLFTVSNVNWTRSATSTELTVTITRFVAPPSAIPLDETNKLQTLADTSAGDTTASTKTPPVTVPVVSEGKS